MMNDLEFQGRKARLILNISRDPYLAVVTNSFLTLSPVAYAKWLDQWATAFACELQDYQMAQEAGIETAGLSGDE